VFNDEGKVETTRFRFMHKPMKTQQDYIAGLVETRKATDIFASRLTQLKDTTVKTDPTPNVEEITYTKSLAGKLRRKLASVAGLSDDEDHSYQTTDLDVEEKKAPVVFCYSLYYVYYD